MKRIFYFLVLSLFIFSCESEKDESVKLNKDGSVDIHITDKALDASHDLITIYETFYVKGNQIKTRVITDTVPSLGEESQTLTNGKNPEQDEDYAEKIVKGRRKYQYFVKLN